MEETYAEIQNAHRRLLEKNQSGLSNLEHNAYEGYNFRVEETSDAITLSGGEQVMPGRKNLVDKSGNDYQSRGRLLRPLSPERRDAFVKRSGDDREFSRSYGDVMRDRENELNKHQRQKRLEEEAHPQNRKRSRWDETPSIERQDDVINNSRWDETPNVQKEVKSRWDEGTPQIEVKRKKSRWDETPQIHQDSDSLKSSRWDETPVHGSVTLSVPLTPDSYMHDKNSIDFRNRPLSDADLDELLPKDGYVILEPPPGYIPVRSQNKLQATPSPIHSGFFMQKSDDSRSIYSDVPTEISAIDSLPNFKPEDIQHFGKLLEHKNEDDLSFEEAKERKVMRLLLRIKNGTPQMRKISLKEITEKARVFGPGPLFKYLLPLLMSPNLEESERHLCVKVIDRILFKLDDLVRPFVHKILVVIEPMLIDEDYYVRSEGREVISNLSKAAGLATMISTMRPDIDHADEYVRNITSRAFAVVSSALGISSILPFLRAVCRSKKSWQARHTGIKIVQQISVLLGNSVLPHLRNLVETIAHGLQDEQPKVKTITALSLASLAESSAPYGFESFESVLKPLWEGIRKHRGKCLAAFLKAIGYVIPLMDAVYANSFTKDIMPILVREFQSPDEEMKKIVLKVVKHCAATDGVDSVYFKKEIIPEYFNNFWVRRMALDRRNYRQLVETTVELANKVGCSEIVSRLVPGLKDESEPFRKMIIETIEKIMSALGASDIDERTEELLMDGVLFVFQEQVIDDSVVLSSCGQIIKVLGLRVKPYLPQISSTVLWRLNNKSARIRQQASDLIAKIASVISICGEEKLLGHLGVVLYEYLGEEYPDVLGSILGALKSIVNVIGMARMNPPVKDLLPRLTPILKNRNDKVQENCVDLVGAIADRGAEFVSAREWMRICYELLEMLKAHRKDIRRAAINTFGYIAKAIGPHDVLSTLLNNLKVQERQNRVCTTIAIAIVAETCGPFTVLPAMMNEYRVPELNVQNGILKSLSFMFEYIGEMAKDYVYSLVTLLEDALIDRDPVHRQTACTAVKHLALGCYGMGCEDALEHLLNFVWPNIFEISPHVINSVMEAIDGLRVSLGPCTILQHCLQGLFHPARKCRETYWKMFNNLYMASQDALVPYYPRIEDEEYTFQRYELDYVI
jgi:splicing factor 3B subunit 1